MSLRKFVLEQKEEGRQEGFKEAEVIYLNKGREEAIAESVQSLHRNNIAAEQIAKLLQLPLEKVQAILR